MLGAMMTCHFKYLIIWYGWIGIIKMIFYKNAEFNSHKFLWEVALYLIIKLNAFLCQLKTCLHYCLKV